MNTDMRTNKLGYTVSDFEAQIFLWMTMKI